MWYLPNLFPLVLKVIINMRNCLSKAFFLSLWLVIGPNSFSVGLLDLQLIVFILHVVCIQKLSRALTGASSAIHCTKDAGSIVNRLRSVIHLNITREFLFDSPKSRVITICSLLHPFWNHWFPCNLFGHLQYELCTNRASACFVQNPITLISVGVIWGKS